MKCKECREKIPDNVKYCPKCGALINDKKYNISMHNSYTQPIQNNTALPSPYNNQSSDTKKSLKLPKLEQKTKARTFLGVFLLYYSDSSAFLLLIKLQVHQIMNIYMKIPIILTALKMRFILM